MNAMDFDDLLVRAVNVLELFQEVRDGYANGFRHMLVDEYQDTNHAQYRWLQLLAAEHRNLIGGRRPGSVGVPVPRGRHPQHPRVRGRLPRRARGPARAELPLDPEDPRRRQRGDRATTAAGSRRSCGRSSGRATRSRSASSRTSTPRRGTSPGRSCGCSTRACSRAEIAVFYRTNAQSRVLEDTLVRPRSPTR